MYPGILGLAIGLILLRFLPALPSTWVVSGVLGGAVWVGWKYPTRWGIGLVAALCGLAWASIYAHWALADRLPDELDGQTFWLEGQVVGLPDVDADSVRFVLEHVTSRHQGIPSRVRLSWHRGPDIRAGTRWRVAARLSRPHGLINPQGFDSEAWFLAQRIGATGTVKAGQPLGGVDRSTTWREVLRQRLLATETWGRAPALVALVLGDGSGLSLQDWRVLQDTGTVHLLVISGQHITLIAAFLFATVACLARTGCWPASWPWLPWASGAALLGALGYGVLAGFEVPIQRACVAVTLGIVWRLRFQQFGAMLPFLLSLDAVLLLNPLAELQPGFWLSFAAVACLIWGFSGRLRPYAAIASLWRAQWLLAIGLLPVLLGLGLPISLTAPIANLLAVPWVGLLILPLALLGTLLLPIPVLGAGLLSLAGCCMDGLFSVLTGISAVQSAWWAPELSCGAWLLVLLGALVLLLPAGLPVRTLGFLFWCPLVFPSLEHPAEGRAQVWVFDVGQGLSVLVRTTEHVLVYDTGPRYGAFDLGQRVLGPSLAALGVRQIDRLVLSHEDLDHAGGAETLARAIPVLSVLSGTQGLLAERLGATPCQSGTEWYWNRVRFRVWRWAHAHNDNQSSCVLMIEASGERLLLTGDIDHLTEAVLQRDASFPIQANWLVLAHHGSKGSSSDAFLGQVAPQAAVIARGYRNAFGHPHPSVLARLKARGILAYDTAHLGALWIRLGNFESPDWARARARFWQTQ